MLSYLDVYPCKHTYQIGVGIAYSSDFLISLAALYMP